jgi:hypothetical protein
MKMQNCCTLVSPEIVKSREIVKSLRAEIDQLVASFALRLVTQRLVTQ